jgi:hypothetical protein
VHLDQRQAVLLERQVERARLRRRHLGRERDRRVDVALGLAVVATLAS